MLMQFVQFESALSEKDVVRVAEDRIDQYAAIPTLKQKYYMKLSAPNHYGGLMIWESPTAMAEFRETELARTVGDAYKVVGAPKVDIYELMFPLRK